MTATKDKIIHDQRLEIGRLRGLVNTLNSRISGMQAALNIEFYKLLHEANPDTDEVKYLKRQTELTRQRMERW